MEQFWTSFVQTGYLSILLGIVIPVLGAGIVFLVLGRRPVERGSQQDMAAYPERVKQLSNDLARASSEVEHVLEEMAIVSRSRTEAFANLEQRVKDLAQHEQELQTRVQTLRNISLPPAEYYLEAHDHPPLPSPRNGYILFGAGTLAGAVITLVLKLVFHI